MSNTLLTSPKQYIQKTSSLKIMEIESFADSAEALRKLLSWPEALSSFKLSGSFKCGLPMDLPMVKDMRVQHRYSLVCLDIGHLPREGRAKLCDFSEFSVLEKLSLSRWQLENPEKHYQILGKYSTTAFRHHGLENLRGLSA